MFRKFSMRTIFLDNALLYSCAAVSTFTNHRLPAALICCSANHRLPEPRAFVYDWIIL